MRSVLAIHRWLGVVLCVAFLLWFPSGIGMMYWDFPGITPAARLEHGSRLDAAAIRVSPAEAYATLGDDDPSPHVRLITHDGRPAYRFGEPDGESLVYADTGEPGGDVSKEQMLRMASAWARQPPGDARVEAIDGIDQWTVQVDVQALRPLWKYSWPDGQQVYVSQAEGEIVQYTTTASRMGAYAGAIPHWLYFTPLRKHGPAWARVVIWSSALGTVAAILGLVIGAWMYAPSKRYRNAGVPTSIPYRGQKRLHMLCGLIFGLGAATWAFSGMLSMEPFPWMSGGPSGGRPPARQGIVRALRGRAPLAACAAKDPRAVLAQMPDADVRELAFASVAGEPMYVATLAGGATRLVPIAGEPREDVDRQRMLDAVAKAAGPDRIAETSVLRQYDAYYLDRRRARPLPVIRVQLADADHSRYYIDPKTARLVGAYSSRDWVHRWLYHGLHSLDFPWLYNHRPLWDIVVITFMVGVTALGVTSLVLAWRVLRRTLARWPAAHQRRRTASTDDLA